MQKELAAEPLSAQVLSWSLVLCHRGCLHKFSHAILYCHPGIDGIPRLTWGCSVKPETSLSFWSVFIASAPSYVPNPFLSGFLLRQALTMWLQLASNLHSSRRSLLRAELTRTRPSCLVFNEKLHAGAASWPTASVVKKMDQELPAIGFAAVGRWKGAGGKEVDWQQTQRNLTSKRPVHQIKSTNGIQRMKGKTGRATRGRSEYKGKRKDLFHTCPLHTSLVRLLQPFH